MERAAIEKDVSDESLMSDLAAGHQEAVGLLYARYAPTILGMAAQALGRPAAEDVVQDVFLSVWKSARTYDPARGPVRPWLHINRNRSRSLPRGETSIQARSRR